MEEMEAGKKLFSSDYFDCAKCHVVGHQLPAGSPDSWAPDLSLAKSRLKPDWVIDWIRNPATVQPGTKMPTFYDPKNFDTAGPEDILNGDENKQIKVLRDFIFTLSSPTEREESQVIAVASDWSLAVPPTQLQRRSHVRLRNASGTDP